MTTTALSAEAAAFLTALPEPSMIVSPSGAVIALNDAARTALEDAPRSLDELTGGPVDLHDYLRDGPLRPGPLSIEGVTVWGARVELAGQALVLLRWTTETDDGRGPDQRLVRRCLELMSRAAEERQRTVEALRRDSKRLRRRAERLQMQALHDALTGVANRRAFDERLTSIFREQVPSVAILMIDIDHFKRFNDDHGHLPGDMALAEVARACSASLRRPADLFARYGGEEFAALLPASSLDGARGVARAMCDRVRRLSLPSALGVSIGVAAGDARAGRPTALLERADDALYAAKRAGRDRVAYWNAERAEPVIDAASLRERGEASR